MVDCPKYGDSLLTSEYNYIRTVEHGVHVYFRKVYNSANQGPAIMWRALGCGEYIKYLDGSDRTKEGVDSLIELFHLARRRGK